MTRMSSPFWAVGPVIVPGEEDRVHRVSLFGHLEGVGEHDAVERLVLHTGLHPLVGVLDVHGRDVVRKQRDLVGMQLSRVLAFERVWRDQSGLDQARDERPRASEMARGYARPRLRASPRRSDG